MMVRIIDQDLEQRALAELKAMEGIRIYIDISPADLISILAALQLALRHPAWHGPSSILVRRFIVKMMAHFVKQPAVIESIKRGFDEAFDYDPEDEQI
jgi:hypothetical protein